MFGYGYNKNIINTVLWILVAYSFLNMYREGTLLPLLLTLPAVIIAITFHEFAHAFAADRLGDTTPRNQGRLTLNPISHLDLFGFVLLVFANIGWGKPVQVNPNNFNSNKSRSFCEAIVALAGPLMNFIIAIIAAFIYVILENFAGAFCATTMGYIVVILVYMLIQVNVGLGVFNLLPIPPLDGEKIFRHVLPYKVQNWIDANYQTICLVFMILWIFGILEIIVSPIISVLMKGLFYIVEIIVGIFV